MVLLSVVEVLRRCGLFGRFFRRTQNRRGHVFPTELRVCVKDRSFWYSNGAPVGVGGPDYRTIVPTF